ncbi:Protein of unknown function [Enterobacter sp. kpr-6]|uniref:DUF2750 domain-containing protein n=1 Tax=Enterobacter sp. kpr-6 TaxID=1761782 RepID=UPI0008E6C395|nr:DUF2750 domain-containing protein [Enterobacter sp. kpr-6]SFR11215.1 Protein of unknown function [Enterobacter sp. kpr-6]
MQLSEKEIEIMSAKNNKERYFYFVKKVVDSEAVWVLDDEGFALSGGDNDEDILMLWPAREYAENCIIDDWKKYKAKELSLNYVMGELLPDLLVKGIKIGVFMVPSISNTPVVNAEDLLLDLENENSKYN